MVKNIINIIGKVKKIKPDLCYYTPTADGWGIYRDLVVLSFLKWQKQKIVLHMHNKGVRIFSDKHRFARWTYRRIFKNTHVILLAKELYPDIQKYVLKENIYYCPMVCLRQILLAMKGLLSILLIHSYSFLI